MELPNRKELDKKLAGIISRLSSKHRKELIALLGDPPSISNVPEEFWEGVENDMYTKLAAVLLIMFAASSRFHGLSRDASRDAAEAYAESRAARVSELYTQHSRERVENYSRQWTERTETTTERITRTEVHERITSVFGPERSTKLAVTETTAAQTEGGETAVREQGIASDLDVWKTNPHLSRSGVCPICAPMHGLPRVRWAAIHPSGPPIHDYCCCEIIYMALVKPGQKRPKPLKESDKAPA